MQYLTALIFAAAILWPPTLSAIPTVKVAVAEKQKLERKVIYAARLEPNRRIRQQSFFLGKVQKHLVKVGERVRKGQGIMYLDRLDLGQDFRGYQVTSHISGTINQIFLEPGMEFNSGADLFEVVDLSLLRARFGVSDKDRFSVAAGKEAFGLAGGKSVAGKVERLGFAADETTGLYPVEVTFPVDQGLSSGQYIEIQVGARSFEGVTIPRQSIVQKFGKPYIFVLKENAAVELRPLELGPEFGAVIGIISGVAEGENIVLEASENLQDGIEVEVSKNQEKRKNRG